MAILPPAIALCDGAARAAGTDPIHPAAAHSLYRRIALIAPLAAPGEYGHASLARARAGRARESVAA